MSFVGGARSIADADKGGRRKGTCADPCETPRRSAHRRDGAVPQKSDNVTLAVALFRQLAHGSLGPERIGNAHGRHLCPSCGPRRPARASYCDCLAASCSPLFSRPGVERSQSVAPDLFSPRARVHARPRALALRANVSVAPPHRAVRGPVNLVRIGAGGRLRIVSSHTAQAPKRARI